MSRRATMVQAPLRLCIREAIGCSYRVGSQSATRLPTMVSVSQRRTLHSTPASKENPVSDFLKHTMRTIRDRGAKFVGAKTTSDKENEKMMEDIKPGDDKSLLRARRKRWGALQTFVDPQTGEVTERVTEHKTSTANFRISPRKLKLLADQIGGGKPIDYAILQMQFSDKRAAGRIKSMLALAKDHATAKGLDPAKLVVAEAWIGKGRTHKRLEIRARSKFGIQTRFEAHMCVVLREGKTHEQRAIEQLNKEKRRVRSVGTGGVIRIERPIINTHQRPGWKW